MKKLSPSAAVDIDQAAPRSGNLDTEAFKQGYRDGAKLRYQIAARSGD